MYQTLGHFIIKPQIRCHEATNYTKSFKWRHNDGFYIIYLTQMKCKMLNLEEYPSNFSIVSIGQQITYISWKLIVVYAPWWSFKVMELADSDILRSTMITSPYISGLKASSPSFWISTWMTALLQKDNRIKNYVNTLWWLFRLPIMLEIRY